ncbi:DUF1330 domain-containing protein [Jannaschia sp. CCS1]|uniref:DUF1330 domain-containing protein n=1 Tax=Jannaschia sp. (strain CCS1) TaxID=290400 RepID=UPI0002DE8659|nr:DUF1330 domain-containing protein [Jannaschia sp. CCS1]
MAKGHIIAHDMDRIARFGDASAAVIGEYGGSVLVRDRDPELRDGKVTGISVVVAFGDIATARAFYESQSYWNAKAIPEAATNTDLHVVEGV